jgi:hypothetical protein
MFYDLAPQNSHLFGNIFQKFKQLHYIFLWDILFFKEAVLFEN